MSDHLARFVQDSLDDRLDRTAQVAAATTLDVLALDFDSIAGFYHGYEEGGGDEPSSAFARPIPESLITKIFNQQTSEDRNNAE